MKTYNLDTIQKVPLREVWPHEAHDFTKWLAEQDKGALRAPGILRRNSACRVRFRW